MSGVLFIVATPIGNLEDITRRAVRTLSEVDRIAAEDTRHTQHLLAHLGLQKPMISLHEHNEHERIAMILDLLSEDLDIALVSDAGTPLISDPGFPLLRAVIEAGFRVVPIPGVSSVITALCAAGVPTDRFCFHGFLPHKNAERLNKLEAIAQLQGTQVLLESTHRIERLLQQLHQLMPQAQVVVAKELTKRHENFIRGQAVDCLDALHQAPELRKGEFVVLIHQPDISAVNKSVLDVEKLLKALLLHMPLKAAVKIAVDASGGKKNELYQLALEISESSRK